MDYTFTCRDGEVAATEPEASGVSTEEEAIACGRLLAENHQQVEIWQGKRLILRFADGAMVQPEQEA